MGKAELEPLVFTERSPDEMSKRARDFVALMRKRRTTRETSEGTRAPTYYANESVGIAAGLFIAAIHDMGLVTLTHTPSPMG